MKVQWHWKARAKENSMLTKLCPLSLSMYQEIGGWLRVSCVVITFMTMGSMYRLSDVVLLNVVVWNTLSTEFDLKEDQRLIYIPQIITHCHSWWIKRPVVAQATRSMQHESVKQRNIEHRQWLNCQAQPQAPAQHGLGLSWLYFHSIQPPNHPPEIPKK